ncbi:Dabb family protein [Aliifodinibius sp. 1BSP15-2V2]|uniref:Dabb family protein n=2 Tax=Fodinibius salsisoli TaxID=2820877 RepID=A0ABT3PHQ7_9BACT|nr:Dabb family protein [Fodinibius salsisoli]MCW9705313.1 Dabb family protein [Fodinibius salsisoli]
MKYSLLFLVVLVSVTCIQPIPVMGQASMLKAQEVSDQTSMDDKELRHVVLIKFKEDATEQEITKVEEAFSALQDKIPVIDDYEWGTNNSPEGLSKGFTHCFFVTFETEEDRETYLPHPDHKAFVKVLEPHMEDVLVIDYWASEE